jgi:hypothetical protein
MSSAEKSLSPDGDRTKVGMGGAILYAVTVIQIRAVKPRIKTARTAILQRPDDLPSPSASICIFVNSRKKISTKISKLIFIANSFPFHARDAAKSH